MIAMITLPLPKILHVYLKMRDLCVAFFNVIKRNVSHDVASGTEITPNIKIDKHCWLTDIGNIIK